MKLNLDVHAWFKMIEMLQNERVFQFVKSISSEPWIGQFKIIQALQIFQSASIWKLSGFRVCIMHRNLNLLKILF